MHTVPTTQKYQRRSARAVAAAMAALLLRLVAVSPSRVCAQDTAAAPAADATAEAPAAAAATPPAPTEPTIVKFSDINSGDTAWMLTSTALVLMMTIPGLALFYGGMVRKKNILGTMMQTFAMMAVITALYDEKLKRSADKQ